MTILPHVLNISSIVCGLTCASISLMPKQPIGIRVFWGILGVLAVLRGCYEIIG